MEKMVGTVRFSIFFVTRESERDEIALVYTLVRRGTVMNTDIVQMVINMETTSNILRKEKLDDTI